MKTKMKKAAKPMMRKSGKVLPKHQIPPGEVRTKLREMLSNIETNPKLQAAYEKTFGQDFMSQGLNVSPKTARRMRSQDEGRQGESETPFQSGVRKGDFSAKDTSFVEDRYKNLKTLYGYDKKGGSVKGKPMMKKSTSMKSKSSKKK